VNADFSARAAKLRRKTLELVEELSQAGVAHDRAGSEALIRVVSAANQLGVAEALLDPARGTSAAADADRPQLSQDTAVVLALAATAVPFAASREDEAERWVRILRMHGQVGAAMQALGIPEAPLESPAQDPGSRVEHQAARGPDVVEAIGDRASDLARRRAADTVTTVDVFFAVLEAYGAAFDRALYSRGATRDEVIARLAAAARV
jgi:hypothetical protein